MIKTLLILHGIQLFKSDRLPTSFFRVYPYESPAFSICGAERASTFSPAWRIQPESHKQLHNLVWSSLHAPQLIPKLINDPPTCYPTHRISSCYIQSSHPIRSTLILKSCTSKHILQTSLVSSVYLTSFHPSHCQTPGTAHLHILSACPSCSVQIRVRTKKRSSYTQISLENTNNIQNQDIISKTYQSFFQLCFLLIQGLHMNLLVF